MGNPVLAKGALVQITDDSTGHGVPEGRKLVVVQYSGEGRTYILSSRDGKYTNIAVIRDDFEVTKDDKVQFEQERDRLAKELAMVTKKLDYMTANKLDEFDLTTFKAYEAIGITEGDATQIDKARALADVVNVQE